MVITIPNMTDPMFLQFDLEEFINITMEIGQSTVSRPDEVHFDYLQLQHDQIF